MREDQGDGLCAVECGSEASATGRKFGLVFQWRIAPALATAGEVQPELARRTACACGDAPRLPETEPPADMAGKSCGELNSGGDKLLPKLDDTASVGVRLDNLALLGTLTVLTFDILPHRSLECAGVVALDPACDRIVHAREAGGEHTPVRYGDADGDGDGDGEGKGEGKRRRYGSSSSSSSSSSCELPKSWSSNSPYRRVALIEEDPLLRRLAR